MQLTSFLHKNFYIFNFNFLHPFNIFFNLTVEIESYFNLNILLQLHQVQYPKYCIEFQSLFLVTQYKDLFNSLTIKDNQLFYMHIVLCISLSQENNFTFLHAATTLLIKYNGSYLIILL